MDIIVLGYQEIGILSSKNKEFYNYARKVVSKNNFNKKQKQVLEDHSKFFWSFDHQFLDNKKGLRNLQRN